MPHKNKTEPVIAVADATVFAGVVYLCILVSGLETRHILYTVASSPAVTGSVFMRRFGFCMYSYNLVMLVKEITFDFFNYAGIHRPVVLYTTPRHGGQIYIKN